MRVLLTTALGPDNLDRRIEEYRRALEWYKAHAIAVYVVECFSPQGPQVFEAYTDRVFYSNVNDVSLKNKGVNEARALLIALDHFQFDPEDMLIKVTGRYLPNSTWFFDRVYESLCSLNPPGVVALIRDGQIFTGVVGVKSGILKSFIKSLDYIDMENNMVNIEYNLYKYINGHGIPFDTVDRVGFSCNVAFRGSIAL